MHDAPVMDEGAAAETAASKALVFAKAKRRLVLGFRRSDGGKERERVGAIGPFFISFP
jgi:hypothetical protein